MHSLRSICTVSLVALGLGQSVVAFANPEAGGSLRESSYLDSSSPRLAKRLTDLPNYVIYAAKLGSVKKNLRNKDGVAFDSCGLWVVTKNYYSTDNGFGHGVFLLANKDKGAFEEINNPDVRQHGWTELGHIAAAKWDDAKKAVLALNLKKPKVYDGTWCRRHARHALRAMDKKGLKRKPGQGREYGVNNKLMTG